MREERARTRLIGGAKVIVFGFVAFHGRGEELVDRDRAESGTAADVEDGEVQGVEDGEGDEEVFGGLGENLHERCRA